MKHLAFFALAVTAAWTVSAAEQPLTIIGQPGSVEVITPQGEVQHIDPQNIEMLNQERPAPGQPPKSSAPEAPQKESAEKPGEQPVPQPPSPPEQAKQPAPPEKKELTPEQLAEKKAAMDHIEELRKVGGAYFYTDDNKPVSGAELDRMLKSGDMENLKAVDFKQQPYTFDFKAIEEGKKEDTPKSR